MRRVLAAIAAALASMGRFVTRQTWNAAKLAWETTTHLVPAVASGAVHIAADVGDTLIATAAAAIKAPLRILSSLGGGSAAAMPSEQQAAASAAQSASQQEKRADDNADARASVSAIRRLALARSRGEDLSLELRSAVPAGFASLILAMAREEAQILTTAKTADLRRWLGDADTAPQGVRGKQKLLADEAALAAAQARATPSEDEHAARRAAVRAALREGRGLRLDEEPVVTIRRAA